jgi:L-fucose dehydrogenase
MDLGLKDHVIVITGGASGIGAAISRACLAEGATVAAITRISSGVEEFAAEMKAANLPFHLHLAELDRTADCRQAILTIARQHGRIDALINNAAINDGVSLEHGDTDRFEASLRLNLVHAYTLAHTALPWLKQARGTILNIASKVAITGQGNTSGYAAAKGGLLALTREWAAELLPYGMRVNAVIPSEVMTPAYQTWLASHVNPDVTLSRITAQIPLEHRMTHPEEIAAMVTFLLSPTQSGHTTAQQLHVDGGYVHLDRMLTANPLH